jgi:hypothetical protein
MLFHHVLDLPQTHSMLPCRCPSHFDCACHETVCEMLDLLLLCGLKGNDCVKITVRNVCAEYAGETALSEIILSLGDAF